MKPGPAAVNMLPHVSLYKEKKSPDSLIKSHMPSKTAHLAMLYNVLFGDPAAQLKPPKHKSHGWQETGNNPSQCSFSTQLISKENQGAAQQQRGKQI